MTSFEDALDRLANSENVYTLYLTGEQAHSVMRALEQAPRTDGEARVVRNRLRKQLDLQEREAEQAQRGEASDSDSAAPHLAPPYALPDAEALLAFHRSPRRHR
ncbi:hypothetical protein ACFZC3_15400 [Streptomyces sp. NPDC007903]|uniref:hypothetical protein n=1 Tax=Streptomyces sp. NPDC007903 TaxID=3364786 RepID=UPI0036EEE9A4